MIDSGVRSSWAASARNARRPSSTGREPRAHVIECTRERAHSRAARYLDSRRVIATFDALRRVGHLLERRAHAAAGHETRSSAAITAITSRTPTRALTGSAAMRTDR